MNSVKLYLPEQKHDREKYKTEIMGLFSMVANALTIGGRHFVCVFGTCLGAVRHHDMIPWDNDIDIAVYRSDYQRSIEILRQRCPDLYVWEWHQDANCCLPYARVFFKIREGVSIERYRAYVDVFIIEGTSNFKVVRHFCSMFFKMILAVLECKAGYRRHPYERSISPTLIVRTIFLPLFFLTRKCLIGLYECVARLQEGEKVEVHELHGCGGYTGRTFPSGTMRCVRNERYGALMVPVPHNAEEYLRVLYGDWRTPPPESARSFSLATDGEGRWMVPGPLDRDRTML